MVDVRDDRIDRCIAELSAHLDGPRRAKADLLREVGHGLADTVDAYREEGMSPGEATRAALTEFGDPVRLASEFQLELASRQTRWALGFLAVVGPVTEVLSRVHWSNSAVEGAQPPPDYTFVLAWLVDFQAWALSLAAVGILLAMDFGLRWFTFGVKLARVVAASIMVKVVVTTVLGGAVMGLFAGSVGLGDIGGIVLAVLNPVSALYLVWLAWRCSRTASYAQRLAMPLRHRGSQHGGDGVGGFAPLVALGR